MKRVWLQCLLVVAAGWIICSSASTAQAQWGYENPGYSYGAVIVAPQPYIGYPVPYSGYGFGYGVPAYGVGYGLGGGYGGYGYGGYRHHSHYHGHYHGRYHGGYGHGHWHGHGRW